MIIKNILTKIKIHPSTYIFLFLSIFIGNFINILLCSILLLGHECGHFFTAYFLRWKTDKIIFYPFGGISYFQTDINSPIKEELFVLIMGPLSQCIIYFFLTFLSFSELHLSLLKMIHYNILFFNLLPIYPLDGGRIVQCISCYFLPYKKSFEFIYMISYFILVIMLSHFLRHYNFNLLIIIILLLTKLYQERKKIKYYIERFFLERYLKKIRFKKTIFIRQEDKFMRDHHHIIKVNNQYLDEQEYLQRKYKK